MTHRPMPYGKLPDGVHRLGRRIRRRWNRALGHRGYRPRTSRPPPRKGPTLSKRWRLAYCAGVTVALFEACLVATERNVLPLHINAAAAWLIAALWGLAAWRMHRRAVRNPRHGYMHVNVSNVPDRYDERELANRIADRMLRRTPRPAPYGKRLGGVLRSLRLIRRRRRRWRDDGDA